MAVPGKPPRPWDIDDFLDIGRRSGATHLKAIPVLILEAWVVGGREEEVANFVRTKDLARRLEGSGLVADRKPKAASSLLGCLVKKQNARNLTRPPLIEYKRAWKNFRIGLPHYEPLLQEYRQIYRKNYPEDYRKLFPEEPDWGYPSLPIARIGREEVKPAPAEPELQDEIRSLLAPPERALREREQTIDILSEKNQKLQAELAALQASERRIVDDELRNDCAELLRNKKYYIDAIRRASVVLETRLREAMGSTEADAKYGAGLVHYALNKDSGRLIISDHPTEQDGVHLLFSGAFAFVRNPPAHKKVKYTDAEAWQVISLIDYLLSLLRQAKPR